MEEAVVGVGGGNVRGVYILLHNVCLQMNVTDTWKWHMDTSDGYTVRSVYQLLTT